MPTARLQAPHQWPDGKARSSCDCVPPVCGIDRWSLPPVKWRVAEAIPQCKMMREARVNLAYVRSSKTGAMAAGAACTERILRLTVTALEGCHHAEPPQLSGGR